MTRKIFPLILILIAGCNNPPVRQYAIYEVFRKERTNELVQLMPIGNEYHCKQGDQIAISMQHIGPDKELLDWEVTANNLGNNRNIEYSYSTKNNIPIHQIHSFTARINGTFEITFITFLAKRNIPMKTYNELHKIRTEGKIILVVKQDL